MELFKIDDKCFDIEQAHIDAMFDEEHKCLIFGLEIVCKRVDDNTLPFITSEALFKTKPHEIKNWHDIAGKIIEWENYSKNIWKPHIKFVNCYKKSFRCNFIYNTKIEFENIENKIFVKIKGLCDSKFNVNEIKTLSLEIETEITCSQILWGKYDENEDEIKNMAKEYFDIGYFEYTKDKDNWIRFIPKGIIK